MWGISQCQETASRQDDDAKNNGSDEEDDAQGSSALNASGNIRFINAKPASTLGEITIV